MKILTGSIFEPIRPRMPDKGDFPSIVTAVKPEALRETEIRSRVTVKADGKDVEIDPLLPGEKEADFSSLGDKGDDDTEKPEKPATEAPDAKKEAPEKAEEPPKEPKQAKGKKEEPVGDIKTPEEEEDDAAVIREQLNKEAKSKEPPKLPDDDTDLDAIQPKPGSNPKIKNDFDRLKEQTKHARAEARRLTTEKAEIEKARAELEEKLKTVKPLDETTQKELDELRTHRRHTMLENDPELVKEFAEKFEAADSRLLSILQEQGLPKDETDPIYIKAVADGVKEPLTVKWIKENLDKLGGAWWKQNILNSLADDPLLQQQVTEAILQRGKLKEEKKQRVAVITKDAAALTTKQEEAQKAHWTEFGHKVNAKGRELAKGDKWANPIEIKPDMTTEAKAQAETHNKAVEGRTKTFLDQIQKAVSHDPEAITEMAYKALHRDVLLEEIKTSQAEIKSRDERIAELEGDIAAVNRTGRISGGSSAPPKDAKKKTEGPKLGETAEEAFEREGF